MKKKKHLDTVGYMDGGASEGRSHPQAEEKRAATEEMDPADMASS